ncbi:MAG: hypothetical protein J6036_06880 [Clostridia bacterium]|nr:hypothetical protein [Clostridia bacterium]
MKKRLFYSIIGIFVFIFMFFGVANKTPLDLSTPADAFMEITDFEFEKTGFLQGEYHLTYECDVCGTTWVLGGTFDGYKMPDSTKQQLVWDNMTDREKSDFPGYCEYCYFEHLCTGCYKEIEDCEKYCKECMKCNDCWDQSKHCNECCEENTLCDGCLDIGEYRCIDCHSSDDFCFNCETCLIAAGANGNVCESDDPKPHCLDCCVDWRCDGCAECFLGRQDDYCLNCYECLSCAAAASDHCKECYVCFDAQEACEGTDDFCRPCCVAAGNHCDECDEHIDDNWCEGGLDGRHCRDCAEANDWICEQCDRCAVCNDFSFCDECGLCFECCSENAANEGCECLEYCVESADFTDEAHLCQQCFYAFSCAEEFCDTCGLCKECCEMNADEYGCTCGLCVEDSEFEEHLCEQCGLPTCERGDFCGECGLCEECCLENSEAEGCSCGICIENSDFEDPDHECADCGQFSCNIDFCEYCGLCLDCCESNSSTEYGCSHGVCTDNPDWNDHYCDTCGKCKEDCDCGQECCADPWAGKSLHGTDVQIGEILIQPFNKKKHVTRDNMSARQASLATFRTKVYDPNGNLNYQWYQKKNGGAPEALVDNTRYVEYRDETFIIVDGAATPRLTVATPSDACHVNYTYYCVISDSHGNVLSTTDEARLVGKHTYEWKWEDDHFHRQVCIGSGCGDTKSGMRKVHDIGPWHFLSYATATTGATLARTCNVCGGISESIKTEPLGANHTAHNYIYIPVTQTDKNGKEVSYTHIKVCRCGKNDGLEEYHDWNQWIVTEAADDHHKGSKYHECLKCNYRETVEIPIQTHEHIFNLHEYDAAFYRVGADRKYHWQYCGDPDCEAVAFKEEHTYGGWMWQLNVPLSLYDATIYRECQVCGYIDVRTIRAGFHPLAFINASKSVLSADNWDSEEKYTCEVTAKPPKGYTFYRWRDTGECGIIFEEYYETYPNGDPKRDSNGNIIWKRYNIYDETVVISLDRYDKNGNFHGLNTLYELTAEISRIDNDVTVYYPDGFSYTLTEGEALDAEEFDIDGTGDVIWYESQVEDEYGYRTVTIHLDGYDGGPLVLENTGLPCDFNIVVDGDSTITANGQNFAILGCYTGGNIKISSSNGAELRLNVRSGKGAEVYGIKARRAKKWYGDKITICGDILVQLDVTNTRSDGEAFGLYSSSWVEILDQASVEMTIRSYADYLGDDRTIAATGVYAKKELQIDTTGYIDIVVHDVDVSNGMKGRGINAKDVIIDNIGSMTVVYPANSKNAYKRKVSYDHKAYIFHAYDDGKRHYYRNGALADVIDVKKLVIEPGYPVTFDVASGSTLNVDYLYTNDLGDYMIKPGDDLIFYTAPASGHYKENVREGAKVLKPSSSDDGVRTKYVLENITAPHTFTVDTGYLFRPFDSQPALSQTDVFFGSEAIVTFTMNNVFSALEGHAKFDGDKPTTPKFALKKLSGGAASSGDLISHGQTANEVFLQRYNEETEFFENTGISFEPTALGNVSFNDEEYSSRLATVRYRLMVLYDGMEYCSDEFTVHWTDNENDRTTPVASAVEIYIKKALRGYPLGVYEDGGAWERLGSEYELLVYDVDQGKGYVETKNEYNKAVNVKKNRKLLKVAEFDYHTGLLTLYGDLQGADFDGDGSTEWYNLSDFLVAIRVPSTVNGGITIDVREETNISGHYEDFGNEGWYGSGGLENVTHTGAIPAVIQNESEYGSVHITSTTESDAFLIL